MGQDAKLFSGGKEGFADCKIPDWAKNPPEALSPKLLRSYAKATKADLTPVEFDTENRCAEFSSKHGYYYTTLESCTTGGKPCGGGFPCKHMYRLAMMLGIMPGKYDDDPSKIKWVRYGIPFEDAVERLETISTGAQEFLLTVIEKLRYRSISRSDIPPDFLAEMEEKEILLHVDDPDEYRLHPDLDKASYKLYRYLRRKFEWDPILLETMEIVSIPHGSASPAISITISLEGAAVSYDRNRNPNAFYFPDDEITAALTKYGCNRCLNGYIPQREETDMTIGQQDHIEMESSSVDATAVTPPATPSPEAETAAPEFSDFVPQELRAIPGLLFEIKGKQTTSPVLWIHGDTKHYESVIQTVGGRWSEKKSAWYIKVTTTGSNFSGQK